MSARESHRLFTVPEAAALVRLTPQSVYRLVSEGKIPSIRVGNAIRIPRRWLDQLIAAAESEGASAQEAEGSPE
ncbi:MAG: helix-turn-helix domain-containing protein [Phycisphaerales bacterium]|nr:helix-turn-helix domain-containing protein [Phycisphaerales bacterium]